MTTEKINLPPSFKAWKISGSDSIETRTAGAALRRDQLCLTPYQILQLIVPKKCNEILLERLPGHDFKLENNYAHPHLFNHISYILPHQALVHFGLHLF